MNQGMSCSHPDSRFLRQETYDIESGPHGVVTGKIRDVFYCTKCLGYTYKPVENQENK